MGEVIRVGGVCV